jgi:GNAT superfamily N-acetyltransferase
MTTKAQRPVNAAAWARAIEPAAIAAWPARNTQELAGWVLRFTSGFTHRGNSVATLDFSGPDVAAAIAAVERSYAEHNLPAMFQLAAQVEPADLAERLLRRGFREVSPTLVQTTEPERMRESLPAPGATRIASQSSAQFAALVISGSRSEADGRERLEILARIEAPLACVTAYEGEQAVSCATATDVSGYVGVNLMRTAVAHRRNGHARRVLAAIADWARERRAHTVYLAVEMANAPAIALYQSASFEIAYTYRYLVKA